jgi:hypothetical protein
MFSFLAIFNYRSKEEQEKHEEDVVQWLLKNDSQKA